MLTEQAKVTRVEDPYVWVETQRQSSCGSCSMNKGCGTSVLSKVVGQKMSNLRVASDLALRPGDYVLISIEDSMLIKGSLLVYALPLVFMLGSAGLFAVVFSQWGLVFSEGWQIISVLGGLALSFWVLKRKNQQYSKSGQFQAKILRKVHPGANCISTDE